MLFGALRQVLVAQGDFGAGGGHAVGVQAHVGHHARQAGLHVVQGAQQLGHFIVALGLQRLRQIALGNALGALHGLAQRAGDGAPNHRCCPHA